METVSLIWKLSTSLVTGLVLLTSSIGGFFGFVYGLGRAGYWLNRKTNWTWTRLDWLPLDRTAPAEDQLDRWLTIGFITLARLIGITLLVGLITLFGWAVLWTKPY